MQVSTITKPSAVSMQVELPNAETRWIPSARRSGASRK
jgi:hypothetical protein